MAKFYVGQRVRIKWSISWPELAGEVGTIVGADEYCSWHPKAGQKCWVVSPDVWGSHIAPVPAEVDGHIAHQFGPGEDQLEPATDANDKIEWSECIWAPEHLREAV